MSDEETGRDTNEMPPEWLSDTPAGDPAERSMLRQIAEEEDVGLIELANGVWYQPKLRPDRDKMS
jgi:hypothetical protein